MTVLDTTIDPPAVTDPDDYVEIGGKRYLTEAGFCRQLRRSPRTVARWDAQRIGPPWIDIGNLKLLDPVKIPAWLETRERNQSQPVQRRRPFRPKRFTASSKTPSQLKSDSAP